MNLSNPITQVFIVTTFLVAIVITILAIAIMKTKKQPSITKTKNQKPINPQTNVQSPILHLRNRKKALGHNPRKQKRKFSEIVAYTLLLSGTIALVTSIFYSSYILAFIGLGVTFWGALLLFVRPTKYVKISLLDSTAISSLKTIDQIITDLNYRGKAVYLPPRYIRTPKGGIAFISSKKGPVIPPVAEISQEKVFLKNPQGICLTPPGLDLANLYENELGKDFAKVNLNYLQQNLPKLFVENLETAEDLEINIEGNMIQVKITGSIYKDLCKETRKLTNICHSIGCPLCSSIAVALTRATGKPVIIETDELSADGKTIETYYRILQE